jgi:hypothetical protein
LSSFWGSIGFESTSNRRGCDHYHAVPLSDGHHVLFIDPLTDKLILGCDAPIGGPVKLLRKMVFVPPDDKAMPRLYAAAADLSNGAIIVAVYGDAIMLYNVPPDIVLYSRAEQEGDNTDRDDLNLSAVSAKSVNHWLNWWDVPMTSDVAAYADPEDPNSPWPMALGGTEVDQLKGVCEISVQTQPEITIRAFTHSSQCKSWRFHNYVDPVVRTKQYICRDGIVHDLCSIDQSGDIIMQDASRPTLECSTINTPLGGHDDERTKAERSDMLGFDGNASGVIKRMLKVLAVENDDWVDLVDVRGCSDAWYDGDGDVVMLYDD